MANKAVTRAQARQAVAFVSDALADKFRMQGRPNAISEGFRRFAAATGSKIDRITFRQRVERAAALYGMRPKARRARSRASAPAFDIDDAARRLRSVLRSGPKTVAELQLRLKLGAREIELAADHLRGAGSNINRTADTFDIPPGRPPAYTGGEAIEIVSRADNTFCFGAFGDLHAASKYSRFDVREDLIRRSEAAGAQAVLDSGNWIDGEARFNRYDLVTTGLEAQCALLAREHPKTKLPIFAVTGDDHEGWYEQREGINVGRYAETVMRAAGHDWRDVGFMEAHIVLRNANSGKTATLALVHPGGGSAYALSYSIQKIVESYEGGEKPAVGIYGHYHKLWAGIIRNVWVVQTGCQQDQTPFMRKKRLEAHVGGTIIGLEQDPRTGAILGMTPRILRYFNKSFYPGARVPRWSHHGPVGRTDRSIDAIHHAHPRGAGTR